MLWNDKLNLHEPFFFLCALSQAIFCVTNAIQVHIVSSIVPVSVNGMPSKHTFPLFPAFTFGIPPCREMNVQTPGTHKCSFWNVDSIPSPWSALWEWFTCGQATWRAQQSTFLSFFPFSYFFLSICHPCTLIRVFLYLGVRKKGEFHPNMKIVVYSPSCCSKRALFPSLPWTQKTILDIISNLLFSLQWE